MRQRIVNPFNLRLRLVTGLFLPLQRSVPECRMISASHERFSDETRNLLQYKPPRYSSAFRDLHPKGFHQKDPGHFCWWKVGPEGCYEQPTDPNHHYLKGGSNG